jgi:glycosidase
MVALVEAAHARGIKVFFDIITNHTADVITYDRDAYDSGGNLPYVSTEQEPYRDASGEPSTTGCTPTATRPSPRSTWTPSPTGPSFLRTKPM